jgi:hypothetical protein
MKDNYDEILEELAKIRTMIEVLFEKDLTEEEIIEYDSLSADEEKVLRMRLGLGEPLKGSLNNNTYKEQV